MIERPDWSGGLPAVTANPRSVDDVRPGEILTGHEVAALSGGGVEADGVPAVLANEMQRTAEGYDDNYALLQDAANRVLGEVAEPERFAESFDTLSPSIRSKALRTLWRNPGIGLLDLVDKVEPQLTLAEAHEAEQWMRQWAGCLR